MPQTLYGIYVWRFGWPPNDRNHVTRRIYTPSYW